jgi:hypothetical protein
MMIDLTYGGRFDENKLVDYIKKSSRNYIIQGQQKCSLENHTKPHSLDYWLRQFAHNKDTKQADNNVVDALVATGLFCKKSDLHCPDNNNLCKGIMIIDSTGDSNVGY